MSAILKSRPVTNNAGYIGGGVDDTAYLQALINAAPKSLRLLDRGYPYVISGLVLNNKKLTGDATLLWKAGSTSAMVDMQGASEIKGLTIDGNAANQVGNYVAITFTNGEDSVIRKCKVQNFRFKVIQTDVLLSSGVDIDNVRFKNCGTQTSCDVVTIRAPYGTVRNCRFKNIGDGHCVRIGLYNGDATTNPVTGVMVTSCRFEDTQHVGITCELYAQDVQISDCYFRNLEQAIKCETLGGTVFDIVISGCTMRDITSTSALNLSADRVTFNNNKCKDMAGGPAFGNDFVCVANSFLRCGAPTIGLIAHQGAVNGGMVADNVIDTPGFRAITVNSATVKANRIKNCPDMAIRIAGAGSVVSANEVDGATNGIVLVSTAADGTCSDNVLKNCSSTPLSATVSNIGWHIKDNVGASEITFTRTIAADAISIGPLARTFSVDTEAGAASDDIVNITGGYAGQTITIKTTVNARDVTVRNATGNLRLAGDFVMDNTDDTLTLYYTGSVWQEIARSNNA